MKQKLLKIITIVMIIATLTLANFLIICVDAVTYAIDVSNSDKTTNHKNVEFMAYFKDSKGEKITTLDAPINSKDLKLYFQISVKREGYFNGNITLGATNFKFDLENANNDINNITENTISLNQINAGDTKEIEVKIDIKREDKYDINLIDLENEISINGTYKDSTEKDIKINSTKNVKLMLINPDDNNEAVLEQKVITNKVLNYKGEQKRIIQIQINTGLKDNMFPIEKTSLKITTPKISNKNPETVLVNTLDILASTGKKISENDYKYNKEEGIVNIDLNNVSEDNRINWVKTGEDVITLTYIYEGTEAAQDETSNIDLSLALYDTKNTVINGTNKIEIDEEEKDSIITVDSIQDEKSIYKGKLYSGISRDISYSTFINVNLTDVANSVDVVEDRNIIEGENLSHNIDSVYKTTQIKRADLEDILGQDGFINILNAESGRLISTITTDSEADENGYINIVYPNNVRQIEIKTSSPKKIGKIEFKNVKVQNTIDADLVKSSSDLKYSVNGKYLTNNEETSLQEVASNIELQETETSAKLEINKESLSAMTTNQNVEFRVILQSKNEKDELFKNPTIRLDLPEKVENIDITSINLLYEDELQIASKNLNGNTIEVVLSGEQTEYKEEAIDGAILIINANLTTSKKIASSTEKVTLTYTNENVKNYKNGASVGQEQKDINIISSAGLITINKIDNYGIEVINNEGDKFGKLAIDADATSVKVENSIINNVGNAINNVSILGTFPTKDAIKDINNIETNIAEAIAVQGIEASRVKLYYSNNANATIDLNDVSNLWRENIEDAKDVKKYLVVIDKLDVYEQIDLSYLVGIPEKLEYNAIAELGYEIYYTNSETNIVEEIKLNNLTLETGKGPVVDTVLKAYIGDKEADKVREGDIVTYSITVSNTGTEEAQDIKVFGKVPENTVYVKANQMEYEMSEEEVEFTPFSIYEDVKDVNFDIQKLVPGESVTNTYKVKVRDNTKGQTASSIVTTVYGEVSKNSNEINSNIEDGDLRLELYAADDINGVLENTYLYRYVVKVKNASDKDKKNVRVNIYADDIIDIQEIFYMTSDDDYIKENENKYIDINNLKSKEEIEVCIVVKAKTIANGEIQKGKISANIEQDKVTYYSNVEEVTVKPVNLQTSMYSENSDSYVKDGDLIEYVVTLKNNGQSYIDNVVVGNALSDKTTLVEIAKNNEMLSEEDYSQYVELETGEDVTVLSTGLEADEQVEYKIRAMVNKIPGNTSSIEIADNITVHSDGVEVDKKQIKHILGPEEEANPDNGDNNNEDDSQNDGDNENNNNNGNSGDNESNSNNQNNGNVGDNESNSNNQDNGNSGNNENNSNNQNNGNTNTSNVAIAERAKSISGTAWIDENENGSKDQNESTLSDITVRLLNTKTNTFVKDINGKDLEVKTNGDGFYSFDTVRNGEYLVVFEYDTSKYILTSYSKDGVDSRNASKVINKTMSINGTDKTVGVTGIIKVNDENISNINIGLQNAKNFDLKLDKYISKVVIQNSKGTTSRDYTNTTFAKAEIDSKLMNGTTAIVEYTIKVTNIGDADAYIKKVADYLSKDYKFSSDLNKDWYQSGSTVYNSSLANEKLKAGESREIKLVVTKQMTDNNTGLVNNTAEIVESYNELGLEENKDNNKAAADLILSIKTGQIATTITLILVTITVIAGATYVIGRYVIKRRGII